MENHIPPTTGFAMRAYMSALTFGFHGRGINPKVEATTVISIKHRHFRVPSIMAASTF